MHPFDHLVFAAPDVDEAVAALSTLCGVTATPGGEHPGAGTRNAIFALGPDAYAEIVGPRCGAVPERSPGARLAALPYARLSTFAVRSSNIAASIARIEGAGFKADPVYALERARPDGVVVKAEIAVIAGHNFGLAAPFIIDWRDSPHPARDCALGCRLVQLEAFGSDAPALRALYAELGVEVAVSHARDTAIAVELETPLGAVRITSGAPLM